MRLMVPTFMCRFMLNRASETAGKIFKPGEIVDLPIGNALLLQTIGGGAIVNLDEVAVNATEHLNIYGGDSWFRHSQQSVSRVGEYLAKIDSDNAPKVN